MFVAIYRNEFLGSINLDVMEKMNPDLENESVIKDLRYFSFEELNLAISHLKDINMLEEGTPSIAVDMSYKEGSYEFVGKLVFLMMEAGIYFTSYVD